MNDNLFGLGILITVSDRATSGLMGISNAVNSTRSAFTELGTQSQANIDKLENSLNQSLITGFALKDMGNTVSSISQAMINPLVNLSKEVISTSSQFEDWRVTLKALYKDADLAKEKLNWGMNLAASTPFDIGTITQAMIGFKAMGVEVDTMFKNSNGHMRSFLEYVGDLGALRPDVGLEGVMMGIRNLVGGDGGKSLKMRLDMDLESILGRSFGDTPEQIMKDIVEVSDKIAGGLMMELEGTWSQIFSNLEDQMTRVVLAIGDGGAFDMAKQAILPFYNAVQSIDDEKLGRIGKNLAEGLSLVIKPIQWVITGLSEVFKVIVDLLAKDSFIAKFAVSFLALGGAITGLTGIFLSTCGGILTTIATLGLFAIQILNNKLVITQFVGALKVGIATASMFMLKLALVAGAVALAWKTNFLGIREGLTTLTKNVKTAFDKSKEIVNYSASDMEKALDKFGQKDFTGKLIYGMTQVGVFFNALVENWNKGKLSDDTFKKVQKLGLEPLVSKLNGFVNTVRDAFKTSKDLMSSNVDDMLGVLNKLDTTTFGGRLIYELTRIRVLFDALVQVWNKGELDSDTFKKVEALGLTPLVQTLDTLKKSFEAFGKGFSKGFKQAVEDVGLFIGGIIKVIVDFITELNPVFEALDIEPIKFGEKFDTTGIEGVGEFIGGLVPKLVLVIGAVKLFKGVLNLAYNVLTLFSKGVGLVLGGIIKLGGGIIKVVKWIGSLVMLNPKVALIVGVIMALVGAGIWLYKNWDIVKEKFGQAIDFIKGKVEEWGNNFSQWFDNIIQGAIDWGVRVADAIRQCVDNVKNWFIDLKNSAINKWNEMTTYVVNKVIELVNGVKTWWSDLVSSVTNYCSTLWSNVTTAWENIKTTITNKVQEAWQNVCTWFNNMISSAGQILSDVQTKVSEAFAKVKEKIAEKLEDAWETATKWWEDIKSIFTSPITATVNFVKKGYEDVKTSISNLTSGNKKKDGSHFNGLSFVPRDGYLAELHRGERVLTAKENKEYNKERSLPQANNEEKSKVFQPSVSNVTNNSLNNAKTNNNSTVNNDNSVTFNQGSIVLNIAQATTEEAERLAKVIMEKIQKEQQLRSRLSYRMG